MSWISIVISGFSQIFFQESIPLGLLIMLGIGIVSPLSLVLATIGNIIGLLVGISLGVKREVIELGIYGFNGVLIGCMVYFYVKQFPIALALTIIASIAAAYIFFIMSRNQITPFATPFIIVGWVLLILIKTLKF